MAEDTKKLCFVVGPIGDPGTDVRCHADWLLNGIIKPVFDAHFPNYKVERADEIVAPGSINSQVITRIMDAALVIADMSMHNANAFYELAIRHMVGLPTIHMILSDWKIPFDVAPYRAIPFSRVHYADLEAAKEALKSTVEEVIKPGFIVENPITHARGVVKIKEHASDELRVILDEMQSLKERVRRTETLAVTATQVAINTERALNTSGVETNPLAKLMSSQPSNATLNALKGRFQLIDPPRPLRAASAMGGLFGVDPPTKDEKDE